MAWVSSSVVVSPSPRVAWVPCGVVGGGWRKSGGEGGAPPASLAGPFDSQGGGVSGHLSANGRVRSL